MSKVIVHIDRLVLRGVDPSDQKAVATALQTELQRQLTEPGIARRIDPGHRYRLDAGQVQMGKEKLGTATGAAISRALTGGKKP